MEEKEAVRGESSLWSLHGLRDFRKSLLRFTNSSNGFTLIELLVVIAILGILATALVGIVDPVGQLQKSRDAQMKSDLAQLKRTLEAYYNDNGKYPDHSTAGTLYLINPPAGPVPWDSTWSAYSTKIPIDPSNPSRSYVYYSPSADGQTYFIFASLERGIKDSQVCNTDSNTATEDRCNNAPWYLLCGAGLICNYGVSSSNTSP